MMDTLLQDLRYALRTLRQRPGFTAVAVLTLALGIGANTAIFGVVDAVLLKALPYPDAAQLVVLSAARGDQQQLLISVPEAEDWQARNRTLIDIGIQRTQSVNLTGTEAPDRLVGSYVTASTMHILGARVTLGRLFRPEETLPGSGQRVVILSAAAWKTRFGAASSVLGRSVTLDGRPHRVIGVLSDAFRDPFSPVDVFLPIASAPSQSWFTRGSPSFWAFGRLKPGVTPEQAREDLSRVARELAQEYPSANANTGASVRTLRDSIVVAGAHGKTTTSGMIAFCLDRLGRDPAGQRRPSPDVVVRGVLGPGDDEGPGRRESLRHDLVRDHRAKGRHRRRYGAACQQSLPRAPRPGLPRLPPAQGRVRVRRGTAARLLWRPVACRGHRGPAR